MEDGGRQRLRGRGVVTMKQTSAKIPVRQSLKVGSGGGHVRLDAKALNRSGKEVVSNRP